MLGSAAVQVDGSRAQWRLGAAIVSVELDEPISSVAIDSERGVLAFLCSGQPNRKTFISVHDSKGALLHTFLEPPDVHFNYLDSNRGCPLAVLAKAYRSGWGDSWYAIDLESGELRLLGEGR